MRVHTGKALIAGAAALALVLTACSSSKSGGGGGGGGGSAGFGDCKQNPNTCNSGTTKKGGTFTYTLEKTVTGWDINNGNSSTFEFAEIMDGVVPAVYNSGPDLKTFLNTDLMVSAEQTSTNPQTLVYKIQPNAVWSDGTPIDVNDFEYQWKTSDGVSCVTGKDKDGADVNPCVPATTAGYANIKSLTGSDNGKTVTIVMKTPYLDWQSMFGSMYPQHIAAQHGDLTTAKGLGDSVTWLDANQPTYSGGPYLVSASVKDTSVTETPNPKWYGKVKPSLDKLVFRIITDQTQEFNALSNGEVQGIYPQPNQDIVTQVKGLTTVNSALGQGLTWEHLDFNEANPILADVKLRTAIFTAISRKDIIAKTIGSFLPDAQPLNNHMYVPGQDGYADNVTATGQGSGDLDKAKSILTDAGYTGVGTALKNKDGKTIKIRCSFTQGNVLRQQTCQIIQNDLKGLGIAVTPTPLDSLGGALASGDFDLIIFAWVGAPFVVSGAQQLFEFNGGGDYGKNKDQAVEDALNAAALELSDPGKVKSLVNQADVALTADAYNLPLYQKPTYLAVYSNIANIRDNATSVGPPYNVQEWGIRAT